MKRSTRQRVRVVVAAGMALPFLLLARPSQASNCAEVRVWQNGQSTPIGSCGYPGSGLDICKRSDLTVGGNGAGYTACVEPPVMN